MSAFDTPDKQITRAWSELASLSLDASPAAIAERTGLDVFAVAATVARLVRVGALPADAAAAS